MKINTLALASLALAVATSAASVLAADSYSNNFNSMPTGALPGGADPRVAGNGQFWVPDNSASSGEVRAGVGLGGTNGLVVGNRGNGNDGVISNVLTPRLSQSAGETGTNSGTGGTTASNNAFHSEFSFRTAPVAQSSSVDGYQFAIESWGGDRNTYLLFEYSTEFGDDSLTFYAADFNDSPNFDGNFITITDELTWGAWYRVTTDVSFVNGPTNDAVTFRLFDQAGNLVATQNAGTWEQGQRVQGYNGGNPLSIDALGFSGRNEYGTTNTVTGDVAYVDNVSYSVAVPEPTTLGLIAGASLVGLRRRRA